MNANELMGELVADHKTEIIEKAASKLAARLAKVCIPDAEKMYRESMHEAINKMVAAQLAGLSTTTFRETDSWGTSRGGVTYTLLEIVLKKVGQWLEVKVDRNGRSDSHSTRDKTRAQWLIQEEAEALVKGELEPAIKQAKADLKRAVEAKLSATFVEALRQCE